jgi:hypothetical protein
MRRKRPQQIRVDGFLAGSVPVGTRSTTQTVGPFVHGGHGANHPLSFPKTRHQSFAPCDSSRGSGAMAQQTRLSWRTANAAC